MDWALALASQSIHPTITNNDGWSLEIEESEYERASRTIEQYSYENRYWRGWSWQHHLPHSSFWFHAGSIFWCVAILTLYYWNKVRFPQLEGLGLMDNVAVGKGEWWRLFTAITLHADVSHLAANISTGLLLLGIAMAAYGPGIGLMMAYLAGAGGNIAGLLIYSSGHRSLGASGMVMGALGLVAVQTFAHWKQDLSSGKRLVVRSFSAAASILMLLGFSPNSDVVAHLGGFVSGCLLGCILHVLPKWVRKSSTINQSCALLTVGWVILTWWLAAK
jgi:rhomboid protease GluP